MSTTRFSDLDRLGRELLRAHEYFGEKYKEIAILQAEITRHRNRCPICCQPERAKTTVVHMTQRGIRRPNERHANEVGGGSKQP